jgi:hypothetical protein
VRVGTLVRVVGAVDLLVLSISIDIRQFEPFCLLALSAIVLKAVKRGNILEAFNGAMLS